MKKTRITIWLEPGKPMKVKTTKADEFFIDDLSKVFDELNRREEGGEDDVARPKKNRTSPKG